MQDDFYTILTPAAEDPVTLAEAKLFLKVENTTDDVLIQGLLDASVSEGENYTNNAFVTRTITGSFASLAISDFEVWPFIQVRRAPLLAVNSVKVLLNDVLTDVSSDNYQLKQINAGFSRILFTDSLICDDTPYPLQVEFTAGYGLAATVPEQIKTAIKQHVNFLYENRGDVVPDGKVVMPLVVQAMYSKFRILNTF
jgi:uncharacterized phiE125 gp8 family phage protein